MNEAYSVGRGRRVSRKKYIRGKQDEKEERR